MKAWTYKVTTAPTCYPVPLDEVKNHLKVSGPNEDALIERLIEAATDYAEDYTKRCFINRTITTYRDCFDGDIELRRSPLSSVTSVKYLLSGVLTAVSTDIYYNTLESDYSVIALEDGESWPSGGDIKKQAVEIIFVAGYGTDERFIPEDIKTAIMHHIAALYENRGDCTLQEALPMASKLIYQKHRIMEI